jgi:cupin fold WbuC family metalloprotein
MIFDIHNQAKRISEEVITSCVTNVAVSRDTISELSTIAKKTSRGRVRLCAHRDTNEIVHEMFIVHPRGAYIPPHKHLAKSESILVIEGETEYFTFYDDGPVKQRISMGDYRSGKSFFFRLQEPLFHSMLILSETLTFLEITKGPFNPSDTVEASWAPNKNCEPEVGQFLNKLSKLCEG